MSGLETLATIASIAGTAVSAVGTIAGGEAQAQAAEFRARQAEKQAQEERAAGQREMFKERRREELTQSRLQAVSAASGGGTTDPTVVGLASDIAQEGEQQALMQFALGENRARGREDQAAAARASGQAARVGSYFSAAGNLLSSGSSIYTKYRGRA